MDNKAFTKKIVNIIIRFCDEVMHFDASWYQKEYPCDQKDNPYYALACFFGEIEQAFMENASMEGVKKFYDKEIGLLSKEEREYIKNTGMNIERYYKSAMIRNDWNKAFESVEEGVQLSGPIGFGFSDSDIKELALLHKANKHRVKIEDLLTDCNFHTECSDFSDGNYDKYIK